MLRKKKKEIKWTLSADSFKDKDGSPESAKKFLEANAGGYQAERGAGKEGYAAPPSTDPDDASGSGAKNTGADLNVPDKGKSGMEDGTEDPQKAGMVAEVLAAEEAVRMARDLTQGRMRFNHYTSGGVRRDEIEVSTLRKISKAIAKMLRIRMDSRKKKNKKMGSSNGAMDRKIVDSGHDEHREEVELIKFKNADFLDYLREEVRDARSRSELRRVFSSNQHWLAMVELAPPEHSHTLLPDELSKMLFKGVEQESEIIINDRAVKKSDFPEHVRLMFSQKPARKRNALVHAVNEATTITATSGDAYLVVYTLVGSGNLISKGLRLRLKNGKDNCRTGIEYSAEKDRIIVESINLFDLLLLRNVKGGGTQTVRLFSLRVCILQQIDIPTWSNVRMASVLVMAPEVVAPPPAPPPREEGGGDTESSEGEEA
jgi:hypothetical protein